MKKSLLIAAVAGLALVSCKKDYTCECTTTSNMPGFVTQTTTSSTGKMKEADAESKCNEGDKTVTVPGFDANGNPVNYTATSGCEIK